MVEFQLCEHMNLMSTGSPQETMRQCTAPVEEREPSTIAHRLVFYLKLFQVTKIATNL